MDGLLLKLLHQHVKQPEPPFWRLFSPIRQDLDRLVWCFSGQPWMGPPPDFNGELVEIAFQDPKARVFADVHLWRPGSLGRFADRFREEYIELWGIEPTRDDPQELATRFCAIPYRKGKKELFIQEHARAWLLYTDCSCWEIFARKTPLLDSLREALSGKPWVALYNSSSDRRQTAFHAAGLSHLWQA
jgi:hypothetical protein